MTDSWPTARIGDLADWRGGLTPSMATPAFWSGGDIPWISSKEVVGGVLTGTERKVTRRAVQETSLRLTPAGSVAVVVRSGILLHTFPVALVPFETTVNQDIKIGTPRPEVMPEYLAYCLAAHGQQILDRCRKTGTTVQSVDVPGFLAFEVPLPPSAVQCRIVDLIGALDAKIEALVAERDCAIALAKTLPVSIHGGVTRPLGASVRARGGKRMPKGVPFSAVPTAHPYLRVVDIESGTFLRDSLMFVPDDVWPSLQRYVVSVGDLVISIVGTIGRVALVPGWAAGVNLTENAAIIDLRDESLDRGWLAAWLTSEPGQREIERVTVGTSQGKLALVRIPLIDVPEIALPVQKRLGSAAAAALSLATALTAEMDQLRRTRQLVLAQLLSGEVEVPELYDSLLEVV